MRAKRLAAQILVSTAMVAPLAVVAAPMAAAAPQVTPVADTGSGSNSGSGTGSSDEVNTIVCQFSSAILQILNPTSPIPRCALPQSMLTQQPPK